ncbi:putative Cystatin domain-containing protein [Rosa chinensis]|uniref:Putative Cystatin domain-containing protein n=1 Tax=Rosa chinensis TaxID=74649 RepID=A0A2P6R6D9_ROSCH|nr:putative Cystatin domain-containing protein [Rosa chinensis]
MRPHVLLALLALLVPLVVADRIVVWKPINSTSDPMVVDTAKFAVSEHNEEAKTNLVFESVVEGRYQVNAGIYYELVVKAKNDSSPASTANYVTVVWDHHLGVRHLIDFYKKD